MKRITRQEFEHCHELPKQQLDAFNTYMDAHPLPEKARMLELYWWNLVAKALAEAQQRRISR